MPHTIKRAIKKISITNDTLFILDAYQDAIRDLSEEQKAVLGLSLAENPSSGSRPLIWLRGFAEFCTGNKYGTTECYLGTIECSLNDFAYQLKECYLLSINCLVEAAGKTSGDAEKNVIDSRYILLRELLLRLVVVALSDEENRKRSGKKLIAALDHFVKAITTDKGETLGLDFKFRMELNQQLARWVGDFESAVATIELIHAPENVLTGLMNYLNRIQKATKAHILVHSGYVHSKDDLSDDWIEKTYQEFLYGKNPSMVVQVDPLTLSPILPSDVQSNRLELIKPYKKRDHISDLFLLLNHTELLYGMVTRLDRIIQASNWVLLLTESLSFDELIERLDLHRDICNDQLNVKKAGLVVDTKACQMLLAKDYISGENMTRVLSGLCEKLRNLGSHRHHRLMVEQFAGDIKELLAYQERLTIKLICDVPMNQGHLKINQSQSVKHPVTQKLLLETTAQNSPASTKINNISSPQTVMAATVETTVQASKLSFGSPQKSNKKNREETYSVELILQSPQNSPNLVHEVPSLIPQVLPNSPNTDVIKVEASYQPIMTTILMPEEINSSTVSIQETTMTEQKYDNNNSFASHARTLVGDPEDELEEAALVDVPEDGLSDINYDQLAINESDPTPWTPAAQAYTGYLKNFFEEYEYEDADYKKVILSLQRYFFEQQITMGGKNRTASDTAWDMEEFNHPNNFLYLFRQNRTFNTAAPFCHEIRNAILKFEAGQMDAGKPTGFRFLLDITEKDVLWECRHLELIYFKYLCVRTAQTAADERNLADFVQRCIHKAEWGVNSDYNDLRTALKAVMQKVTNNRIKLRKYLGMTPQVQQAAKIVQLSARINDLEKQNTALITEKNAILNERASIQRNYQEQVERYRIENQQKNVEINGLKTTVKKQGQELSGYRQELKNQRADFDKKFELIQNQNEKRYQELCARLNRREEQENMNFHPPSTSTRINQGGSPSYQPVFQSAPRHDEGQRYYFGETPPERHDEFKPEETSGCTIL